MLCMLSPSFIFIFFFNDTATTEIYTLSLHDALPILLDWAAGPSVAVRVVTPAELVNFVLTAVVAGVSYGVRGSRSEEHTSELQSRLHLVCRLLLEKKNKQICRHR